MRWSHRVGLETAAGWVEGEIQKLRLEARTRIDADIGDETDFTAILRLWTDPAFDFGQMESHAFPELSDGTLPWRIGEEGEFELREAYLRTPLGDATLTLGKQQIVWGVADGLKVLDVVNPMDLREFILDDFEDSRIPLWAVNAQIPLRKWELQVVWLPDPSCHILPRLDSEYEIRSSTPEWPPWLDVVQEPPDKPGRLLADSDAGARLSTSRGGWDLTFNYLYHHDDVPALRRRFALTLDGPAVVVRPDYERGHVIGGTLGKTFGRVAVRGEYGLFLDRPYSTDRLRDRDGVVTVDEISYVIGVDWFALGGTFFSTQLFQNWVPDDPPGLVRDRLQTYGTFAVQRRYLHDALTLETFWIHALNDGDGLWRARATYDFSDAWRIYGGVDVFYGQSRGFFGQFDGRDRIVFGLQWSF